MGLTLTIGASASSNKEPEIMSIDDLLRRYIPNTSTADRGNDPQLDNGRYWHTGVQARYGRRPAIPEGLKSKIDQFIRDEDMHEHGRWGGKFVMNVRKGIWVCTADTSIDKGFFYRLKNSEKLQHAIKEFVSELEESGKPQKPGLAATSFFQARAYIDQLQRFGRDHVKDFLKTYGGKKHGTD